MFNRLMKEPVFNYTPGQPAVMYRPAYCTTITEVTLTSTSRNIVPTMGVNSGSGGSKGVVNAGLTAVGVDTGWGF